MTNFKSALNQPVGAITEWQKHSFGISGKTNEAIFRVRFYSDSIVQVTLSRDSVFEDFSYAVVAKPTYTEFVVSDSDQVIVLNTPRLAVSIQKNPLRISFLNQANEVINEDDPSFGTSWSGDQVTTYKKLREGERFIGLGEKTGTLDRKGSGYQNWNTDAYGYHAGTDPLYCSTPFYIGIHHQHVYGIFLDNTYKTFFNFGASNNRFSYFSADFGEMNYYFIHGDHVADILRNYTGLTGRMELPPLWSLGYQQCRYSYYPDKEVINIANTFRDKDIPADAIVFDIHYMDKYKIFTWNKEHFPDPQNLLHKLRQAGFHVVVMCDPGIKTEPGYAAYDDGIKSDVFIKYPDGTPYTGQVWPGWCHFPDFTHPETRKWWARQFKDYVELGIEGFWNDMNEIATWGHMLPENIELNFEGNKASMRRGRNIYGMQMARTTYESTKALLNGKRPFNLTRSGFSGIQRYAAVWTGDNVAYDEHMMLGVRLVNSMGLTGIAFAGYDVGGFVGDATTKLFTRWLSIGSFSPFFRGHSMINSRDSEPWSYGEEAEQICRNYIKLRYRLMPYIYSLFYKASQTGIPVQRSLALEYATNPKIYDHQYHHQYTFGPSILVAPVESTKEITKVYLPPGTWYSLYDGKPYKGDTEIMVECPIHRLPVFVKGSSLIPMQQPGKNTGEEVQVMDLHIYTGSQPSTFLFYQDDGRTYDYQNGQFASRLLEFIPSEQKLIIGKQVGEFHSSLKRWKLIFHGFEQLSSITVNGGTLQTTREVNRFFAPLEKYDPINDPEPAPEEPVITTIIDQTIEEIIVTWKA